MGRQVGYSFIMVANVFREGSANYYRLGPLLSRNGAINMVLGPRGDGKTFAAKEQAIRNAINRGEEFIYLRRYQKELESRHTFFDDIRFKFPDHEFKVDGKRAMMKSPGDNKFVCIGYFVALSTSQQKKSVAFPKVSLIIFDEFLIDKGAIRYIPQEVKVLLDFLSTVDRYKDKTRIVMISNSVAIANPYFQEWSIRVKPGQEWWADKTGFVIAHFIKDHVFAQQVRQTRLGAFISETEYGKYAVDAEFSDNGDNLIKSKTSNSRYRFTLETATGTFSVWSDSVEGFYYVQSKRPRGNETMLTMLPNSVNESVSLVAFNHKLLGQLRTSYSHGRMFFDGPESRNSFVGVLT